MGRLPAYAPRITTSRGGRFSRLQIFLYVPASKFARPPDRSYRCEYCRRAAGAFTSGPIVLCYLHTHRVCLLSGFSRLISECGHSSWGSMSRRAFAAQRRARDDAIVGSTGLGCRRFSRIRKKHTYVKDVNPGRSSQRCPLHARFALASL